MAPTIGASPCSSCGPAFEAGDWVGVLLKTYRTGRVGAADRAASTRRLSERFQALASSHERARLERVRERERRIGPAGRGRGTPWRAFATCSSRRIATDPGCSRLCRRGRISRRRRTCLHSSPGRLHVLWRVARHATRATSSSCRSDWRANSATDRGGHVERADHAGCRGSSTTSGDRPVRVGIEFLHCDDVVSARRPSRHGPRRRRRQPCRDAPTRHRCAGSRGPCARVPSDASIRPSLDSDGDLRTFRVCCRVVRGFDLSDDEAMSALSEWNARCEPPWTERELRQKVTNARRYGREPMWRPSVSAVMQMLVSSTAVRLAST